MANKAMLIYEASYYFATHLILYFKYRALSFPSMSIDISRDPNFPSKYTKYISMRDFVRADCRIYGLVYLSSLKYGFC